MRLRKCKMCGCEFEGERQQRLCPTCRKESRRASVMRDRECQACGIIFSGSPRARYCPDCRQERKDQARREYMQRKAAHKERPIGSTDICQACGKAYIVTGSLQKYCPDCAESAVKAKVLPQKRARAAAHIAENAARKKDLLDQSAVCAYCGQPYTPKGPSVTCSEECAREYKRIVQGWADYRRGRRKNPPAHTRYDSGLPQSDMVGVNYHRLNGKWQVTHRGKYIGLFDNKETAEAKKRELIESDYTD